MKYVPKNDLPHPIAWVGFESKIVNYDPIETIVDRQYYFSNPDYAALFNQFWNAPKQPPFFSQADRLADWMSWPQQLE